MGVKERKERMRQQVRCDILKNARIIALEEGWQGVTIRKIADRIEYTPPVIYEHFKNKDAILLELREEGFSLLEQKILKAVAKEPVPGEKVRKLSLAYWNFALKNPEYYEVMFDSGQVCCAPGQPSENMKKCGKQIQDYMQGFAGVAQKKPKQFFMIWFSFMHGLVSLTMGSQFKIDKKDGESMIQECIQMWEGGG